MIPKLHRCIAMIPQLHHTISPLLVCVLCASVVTAQAQSPGEAAFLLPRLFDEFDANKDGEVTLEQVTAFNAKRRPVDAPNEPPSAAPRTTTPDAFVPDAPFVGEINGSYIDPEISESANQVVFQDMRNRVWIGDIDPETGLFKTATGRDYLMDENITIIFDRPPQGRKFSTNGPEWARDETGHLVVYTKEDSAGIMQQWAARLVDGKSVVTQLTRNSFDCYGNMPSRFQDGKPPRVAYTYNWPIWRAKAAWIFLDRPEAPRELANFDYNQMSMWSAVSPHFLFVQKPPGAPHGQIAMSDANTGEVRVLTVDPGVKDDPGLFNAPEFSSETLLVCNVDNSKLCIYRDEKRDGKSPWMRIATLTLPEEAPHKFISSPETVASAAGVGGVSYFSLLARENKDRRSRGSIWVLGLGTDEKNRFARRVDDGASSMVLEPEPFVGKSEVYVYYNAYNPLTRENGLRRAATGIKVDVAPPAATQPRVAASTQSPAKAISIHEELTKPSLEVCLTASDETAARKFLAEGLGLAERPAPSAAAGRLLLFAAGDSTIKVRQHNAPTTPPAISAQNGLRVLTVPVENLDEVAARLNRLGFDCGQVSESGGVRWVLTRNADGTPFDLIDATVGAPRQLEIGLVVPDLTTAREFFAGVYGAKELPEATSRVLPGEKELRFSTGATVFKCWSPPGERESDTGKVADSLGFRYVTHKVRDPQRLLDAFQTRGVEIAIPMSDYRGIARLFFARGPGGVLLEFLAINEPKAN
jgi:catechol 2,3-dioxygenase-like lactoylglutathione lyase family enzyme